MIIIFLLGFSTLQVSQPYLFSSYTIITPIPYYIINRLPFSFHAQILGITAAPFEFSSQYVKHPITLPCFVQRKIKYKLNGAKIDVPFRVVLLGRKASMVRAFFHTSLPSTRDIYELELEILVFWKDKQLKYCFTW